MSETVNVRGTSDSLFEGMTKEQIITAIEQATGGTVGDLDSGFITIWKEQNNGLGIKLWVGTTAQYNALTDRPTNTIYIKTDDTSAQDINTAITNINSALSTLQTQYQASAGDTGWISVIAGMYGTGWSAGSNAPHYRKIGRHVYIQGEVVAGASATSTILTMPSGYRAGGCPPKLNYCGNDIWCDIRHYSSGEVQIAKGFDLSNGSAVITNFSGKTIFLDIEYFV